MTDTRAHFDDEARLTAYVLGELDESDATVIEAEMREDDALRREVEEIRATTAMLQAELSAEPAPGLTEQQRAAVTAGADRAAGNRARRNGSPVLFTIRSVWAGVGLAAAACLLLATGIFWTQEWRERDEVAIEPPARSNAIDDRLAKNETATALGGRGTESLEMERRRPPPGPGDQAEGVAPLLMEESADLNAAGTRERAASGSAAPRSRTDRRDESVEDLAGKQPPERRLRPDPDAPARPPFSGRPSVYADLALGGPAGGGGSSGNISAEEAEADRFLPADGQWNREAYDQLIDNPFIRPEGLSAFSTFSIDVDTASYSNIRRYLDHGRMPPPDAVRIEEMINYFDYGYEPPTGEDPFSVNTEVNACPWAPEHRLVRIGLQGREIPRDMRPATSLVFLIDVSGSMNQPNKLPLLKESMKLLVENLLPDDKVAMVAYAGASGIVLPSTFCDDKQVIIDALDELRPGGSTHGSAGIQLAYELAEENFIKGGANRVILCTDGDFNVGVSDDGSLVRLIEQKRESGVFLSVLGFGAGNWQDAKMEKLSNAGNGNFAYIDNLDEAKKVLVEQMSGTLVTIARDVKIQVEFNPEKVAAYRLIGYTNRLLAAEDFNNDRKDAGEIGAGHTVTALYEVVPVGVEIDLPSIDALEFQQPAEGEEPEAGEHLLLVKLRYKQPDEDESKLMKRYIPDEGADRVDATEDFQFAAAVAAFGMLLRDTQYKGGATYEMVLDLATAGRGADGHGYRAAFIDLVERAKLIADQASR